MIPQLYTTYYGHLESLFNQPRNYFGASITTEVAIHCATLFTVVLIQLLLCVGGQIDNVDTHTQVHIHINKVLKTHKPTIFIVGP